MKKNLKVLTAAAAAVMAAASLTACGGSSASATTAAETKAESTEAGAESSEAAKDEKKEDAKDAKADSADKKVLKVAMECAYAPYNWTQPDDSNGAVPIADSNEYAYGYDVMMAKKIADELGYDLQIVRLDWDSLIPAVQTGQVDCVIAGQSITKERQEAVDFTDPYYYASIVTLVKKGGKYENAASVADLAGATCTSQQSTIWYTVCLPQIKDANILSATASAPDMLMSLEADKCDIVVTDQPTGKGALVAYPDFKMLEFGGGDNDFQVSDEDINIGISLKKGNTELKDAINGVLATMNKDDYAKMMDEAIAVQPLAN
ncbi:transporter substrate-binding domain-containing protein [Brotaphodocola sp.]|uniref:transporter substrate-binding domain-containing protein n=1 Tax=Brotaphodocola sp. TaxID=3073577 RepID=UPI003D7E5B34